MTMTPPTPAHTIEELCKRSHMISKEKGWVSEDGDKRPFHTIAILIHSELSEALEDWRNHKTVGEKYYELAVVNDQGVKYTETYDEAAWKAHQRTLERTHVGGENDGKPFVAKPCGIPIELADFIIRIAQYVGTEAATRDYLGAREFAGLCEPLLYKENFDEYVSDAHYSIAMSSRDAASDGGRFYWLAMATRLTFGFCEKNDIDLWAAIDEKEAYNRTRPHKHGGKKV